MTILTQTFIFDLDGHRFKVGCLACGWRALEKSWTAALRIERRHACSRPTEARP